jgi:hypothetical protein
MWLLKIVRSIPNDENLRASPPWGVEMVESEAMAGQTTFLFLPGFRQKG